MTLDDTSEVPSGSRKSKLPQALSPLAYREYRLFWSASVVSNVGTWMYLAAIGWFTEVITDSPFRVSLVVTAGIIPLLFFSPLGGLLADRMPRVRLMIITVVLQTVASLGLALAYLADAATFWVLFMFSMLNGAVASLAAPAQQAIIPQLLPERHLRGGVVMNSTQWNISRSVGPLIAGYVVTFWNEGAVFWINTATFVVMIFVLARMKPVPAPGMSAPNVCPECQPRGFGKMTQAMANKTAAQQKPRGMTPMMAQMTTPTVTPMTTQWKKSGGFWLNSPKASVMCERTEG